MAGLYNTYLTRYVQNSIFVDHIESNRHYSEQYETEFGVSTGYKIKYFDSQFEFGVSFTWYKSYLKSEYK